jgi:D-alanyl-D-alanine carboxypeptidase
VKNVVKRSLVGLVVFAVAASFVSAGGGPLAQKPEVAAAIQVFDAWVEWTVRNREQPGVSIGIVHDQELIWSKGYGFADVAKKTPATNATAYRIASLSKLFAATALLQLRDAGKLQLDDPVAKHLSWFRLQNRHPDSPTITVRHLITHTSGMPRELTGTYWNDMDFPDSEEISRMLAKEETILPTETEWKYSNLALAIAGEVVAAVSGEPYAQYVERHIFAPLGMSSSRVLPERGWSALATGYGRRVPEKARRIEPHTDMGGMGAAGNLASTVSDLAKFLSLQFRDKPTGGSQILKGSTLREMHRVQWLQANWQSGWGLGWGVRRWGEQVRIAHGGAVPGHRTQISAAPAEKFGVIVLTNAEDGQPSLYVNQAFAILGPVIAKAVEPPAPDVGKAEPAWSKYVGTYTWEDDAALVMILDRKLTLVDPSEDDPWAGRVTLEPVSPGVFRMKGGSQTGELVRFETDKAGRVTRLIFPGYYVVREP